jgi:hypothetical protein
MPDEIKNDTGLRTTPEPVSPLITLKEEGVKIIYRNAEPIACYKQNGTLKMYKLVEVTYADIAEIYEPSARV